MPLSIGERQHQPGRMACPRTVICALALTAVMTLTVVGCSSDVTQTRGMVPAGSVTQTYYIGADEVAWNYAPAGRNLITGQSFGDTENTYVASGPDRIGSTYKKSLFREYTDGTFAKVKLRPAAWEHLGMLGPVIRAEVGDTIKVIFKNHTKFPASLHPHGLFYEKDSEGSPYDDGTSGADKADDSVPTGGSHTYIWQVPERAGPGPNDGSSIMWMYHSHVDEVADTYAGLMGPIIVMRRGMTRPDRSLKDIDREFVTMFMVADENKSPWLDENIQRYAGNPASVKKDDSEFIESNKMHSINGFVFGNLPDLQMPKGERVRWYLMGMGTEVDLHTPHWHGNTVLVMGSRTDVTSLLPATMVAADMQPDDPGVWQYHCHVADHIQAGMQARYTVTS